MNSCVLLRCGREMVSSTASRKVGRKEGRLAGRPKIVSNNDWWWMVVVRALQYLVRFLMTESAHDRDQAIIDLRVLYF